MVVTMMTSPRSTCICQETHADTATVTISWVYKIVNINQYSRISFLRSFPNINVVWTWSSCQCWQSYVSCCSFSMNAWEHVNMFIWRMVWYYKKTGKKKHWNVYNARHDRPPTFYIRLHTPRYKKSVCVSTLKVSNQNCYVTELCIHIIY